MEPEVAQVRPPEGPHTMWLPFPPGNGPSLLSFLARPRTHRTHGRCAPWLPLLAVVLFGLPWVAAPQYKRIAAAIAGVQKHAPPDEAWRLQPIYAALDGEVPYDDIRLVVAHLKPQAVSSDVS